MEEKSICRSGISKIAVTGPESSGKSVITQQLANHFKEPATTEYARHYLELLGRPYTFEDVLCIAKGQLAEEKKLLSSARHFLFCDTDLVVIYVWMKFKYENIHPWVTEQLKKKPYDLHLLMAPDLPWQPDPLREHPNARQELFGIYQQTLEKFKLPYRIISGTGDSRTQMAITKIKASVGLCGS